MKRTTIFVPEGLERDLQLYARRAGKSAAAVVREAVAAYLARRGPEKRLPSFAGAFASGRADTAERNENCCSGTSRRAAIVAVEPLPRPRPDPAHRAPPPTLMPLLVDTGIVYALADRRDSWHARVRAYLESSATHCLRPSRSFLRSRICCDIASALGRSTLFVTSIANGELAVEDLSGPDWTRAAELMATYTWLGIVDATVVAVAERLKLTRVATTDRRHFGNVRPAHVGRFSLVP